LDYNAFVYQTTGEDWDDISLTISTGTPRQNKTKPNLNTWNLFAQAPAPVYKQPRNKSYNAASANQYLQSQAWNPNVREVRGRVTDEYGQSLPFVNITLAGSNQGCTTDVNGNYYIAIPQGYGILNYSFVGYNNVQLNASSNTMNVVMGNNSISLDEVQVLSAPSTAIYDLDSRMNEDVSSGGALFGNREKKQKDVAAIDYAAVKVAYSPTQTQFKVDANYNIPANGSHYAVRVSTHEVEADYLYQCAPKLDPLAYLTARVTDWEDLNLLAGNMNIYFEDTYIGQSKLDLSFVEDTLAISLGPDRNIQVKRNRIKADSKKEFISGKKNIEREWEITVLNNKRVDINIRIEDQIPVSSNEEVEIDSHVDGGKLNKDTGIITWDFDIKAGKKKEIKFDYEVRFPKNLMVKLD
ncbi:MAG: mucoidy inhibitor MuiA family protein, partial [Flavobacteriales bacterium]